MTLELRLTKIAMSASLALFACLVAFGNITDYASNFAFVQHVLSMDTTFPDNALRWRAITSPMLWHLAYWLIILGEALTCAAYAIGTAALTRKLRASGAEFNRSKRMIYLATTLGFLVWFLGFMVIGGEWFAMWQSPKWNGVPSAFRFAVVIIAALIFVAMRDEEIEG
jgi:predicted small integral membrane protein